MGTLKELAYAMMPIRRMAAMWMYVEDRPAITGFRSGRGVTVSMHFSCEKSDKVDRI
jgi:hypothetical protein